MSFVSRNHPQQTAARGPLDEVDDRGTDQAYFDALSDRFGGFTLDVAAAPHNAKCERFYTRADDGLQQPWGGRVWCNPPYSNITDWVQKAHAEWERGTEPLDLIVMLLPANRTEQAWWQDWVEPWRDSNPNSLFQSVLRVEFLRGRMRFDRPDVVVGPKGDRPPFGCCLLIWERR